MDLWDNTFEKIEAQETLSFINNNKAFKKAIDFASKYKEDTYDDVIRQNMDFIKELKRKAES